MNEIASTTPSPARLSRSHRRGSTRTAAALVGIAAAVGVLTACGSDSATSTTAKPATQDAGGAAAPGAEPNAANGEGAAVRYTNSKFHYQVDGPGVLKETADGSAAYVGGTERLEIMVVSGASAADPRAFAASDTNALPGSHPSFKVARQLAQVIISGVAVQKVVFSWTDGVNQVTSRPNDLVTVRYYIPRNSTTLAVFTYSISAKQYDPQGADDVASTFKWL